MEGVKLGAKVCMTRVPRYSAKQEIGVLVDYPPSLSLSLPLPLPLPPSLPPSLARSLSLSLLVYISDDDTKNL